MYSSDMRMQLGNFKETRRFIAILDSILNSTEYTSDLVLISRGLTRAPLLFRNSERITNTALSRARYTRRAAHYSNFTRRKHRH